MARSRIAVGSVILRDHITMRIEITPQQDERSATAVAAADGTTAPAPVLTLESAPNAAAASIPLLARLMALLTAAMQTDASALDRRLGALVRRLAWEPLERLRERDADSADFLAATAQAFVTATATELDSDPSRASHRALLVSLAERLLSALKLNSFLGRDSADERRHSVMMLPLMAAVNHSCRPNAALHHDQLVAIGDIEPNQQICISYLNDNDLRVDAPTRQAKLFHSWGFQCGCGRCSDEQKQSSDE